MSEYAASQAHFSSSVGAGAELAEDVGFSRSALFACQGSSPRRHRWQLHGRAMGHQWQHRGKAIRRCSHQTSRSRLRWLPGYPEGVSTFGLKWPITRRVTPVIASFLGDFVTGIADVPHVPSWSSFRPTALNDVGRRWLGCLSSLRWFIAL